MHEPRQYYLNPNGVFPNSKLPVLQYIQALKLPMLLKGRTIRKLLKDNGWGNNWRAGIYTYHHYHSDTHEVMAAISGHAAILLGGENGHSIVLNAGDVLIIPAGVAHKNLGKENDVICIGGYPEGRDYDMKHGKSGERPAADQHIAEIPIPNTDPITRTENPLKILWQYA